jgi:hypothetical protein
MEQFPVVTSVTVLPETVQVDGVFEEKLTGRPDEAVAETVNGGVPYGLLVKGANVMVCASFVIWKAWLTGVAAAKVALPGCDALMEQLPVVTSVTVLPETVHVVGVFEEKLTGKPDDAVAVTVNGGVPIGRFGSGLKVMVCGVVPTVTWKLRVTGVAAR